MSNNERSEKLANEVSHPAPVTAQDFINAIKGACMGCYLQDEDLGEDTGERKVFIDGDFDKKTLVSNFDALISKARQEAVEEYKQSLTHGN